MQLMDVRTGAKVQFITLRNGKRVGLDKDIYTILDVNFTDWGDCELLLECDGHEIYTTHESIELASDLAIKAYEAEKERSQTNYIQMTIFDLLEV